MHLMPSFTLSNAAVLPLLCMFLRCQPSDNEVFKEGDLVFISGKEPEYIAMATGVIAKINNNFITVDSER